MRAFLLGTALCLGLGACADEADPGQDRSTTRPALVEAPDAATLPEALTEGRVQPVQVVATYIKRIELLDDSGPRINSVIRVNPNAVSDAQRLVAGESRGLLHGLPILVKDNIETRDMPTTAGSLALLANDTGRDAPVIARLREEGAVILGKTNLSEWANFRSSQSVSGWSAVGGLTRNPHDLSRNACGSSSGSGAAVAAGFAWAALGTETNGSVTCPAALNGIVGFKPTVGLVSRSLVVPISPSQDTVGPMATSVEDAARILTVIAGTDPEDEATGEADARKIDYLSALDGASLDGVRIGVLRWAQSDDPREKEVFDKALARAEEAGAILVDIEEADLNVSGADAFTVLKAEFKESLNAYLSDAASGVEVRTLEDLIVFNESNDRELSLFGQDIFDDSQDMAGLDDEGYRTALDNVQRGTREEGIDRFLEESDVDVLVAPSFGPAFTIDLIRGDIIASNAGAGWVAAIAGYPHLTLPMGEVGGLPLGLSIMGTKWADADVLRIGHAFEKVLPKRLEPTFRTGAEAIPTIDEATKPSLQP